MTQILELERASPGMYDNPEDDFDEDDFEDGDAFDHDDEEPTIACPYCRRQIHEDAQRCPYCEKYISQEDAPPAPKPWWLIAGVILCLYLLLRWLIW